MSEEFEINPSGGATLELQFMLIALDSLLHLSAYS
ncbi:hypothetical protein CFBP8129_04160 [Xanthomonas hortorum pv. gardneri]|uniref:Uncharacterized protein n=1 Tax=Xanthomonas hortorum pv. gardneri TaxID=2754056 RepID=A0A6V7BNW7_9XANT|nr:hypothetical protein CFBP2044_04190 [Xanthomonas hortorum pv. cynarae]CAD0302806.1 hypothetical protein CFBP2044_04190 [Xanthomonas hortorum pv. cynarae]CAD0302813.1 hypothetical protein CFBP8129_04160 [Xanthomonas hortorum pv. gardneri]CAD0302819.1 hypothetical protein CFBP8129_04160 [Xanthomonas hortorum pv. gardneri]CAH2706566.1 hypothetical protein NCPPB1935_02100 [Xanthomonas campestris pv. nigromaculans]